MSMPQQVAGCLEAVFSARTAGPGHGVGPAEPCIAGVDASEDERAALAWVAALHGAFYASAPQRGTNRFLEMEAALAGVFGRLSGGVERAFWPFVSRVVLLLAREKEKEKGAQGNVDGTDGENGAGGGSGETAARGAALATADRGKKDKKKKKKQAQPFVPLAFMVVNALKKLAEGEDGGDQLSLCHHEGWTNSELREFCARGLGDSIFVDQKLLVEMIELFAITDLDSTLVIEAASSLLSARSYTALIKLVGIFDSIDWTLSDYVKAMTSSKDWSSAELLVKTLDQSSEKTLARLLVEEAVAVQEFKRAHHLVYKFELQEAYPDIEHVYFRDGLMKLLEKQRWDIAISFAGTDESLRRTVLESMVAAGEFFRAVQLANMLQLEDFHISSEPHSSLRGVSQFHGSTFAAAVNGFLELELDCDSVVQFCSTELDVRRAYEHFFGPEGKQEDVKSSFTNGSAFGRDYVVGLDVEWKPTSSKIAAATGSLTTTAVASILQIATATRVFIIDLLALHDCSYLFDSFLSRLFDSPAHLKVGFGFDTDLKVLHQTFPERPACRSAAPFIELSSIVHKFFGALTGNSLSSATSAILGKPLDKKMQLSNWDARPLSRDQLAYAALDAYCLVQIIDKLMSVIDPPPINATLPAWKEVAAHIGSLMLSSLLDEEDSEAAVALRRAYHAKWIETRKSTAHPTSDQPDRLRGPDDIKSYWDQQVQSCSMKPAVGEDSDGDCAINTHLEFLPVADAHELLKHQSTDDHPTVVAVNTICFFADECPTVACIDASCKLDTAQLAVLIGVSRRKVKLATALECQAQFGFSPGTIPPFGHGPAISSTSDGDDNSLDIPIYADASLQNAEHLLCGGGSPDVLLYLEARTFFSVIDIEAVADIQRGVSAFSSAAPVTSSAPNREVITDASTTDLLSPSEQELKFLADSMVVRMGKWLRTMGHDVVVWDPYAFPKKTGAHDHKAALLALASREQRILLTRDKKLASRRDAGACFVVSSDDPHEQFREVRAHFALRLVESEMMSRCARCNAKGFDIVDAEFVRTQQDDEVHPNVLEVVTEFWVCRVCRKIFWEGPKFTSSYQNVRRMFEDQDGGSVDAE